MSTCNHCGKPTLAGATSCQNCGMPLSSAFYSDGGGQPGMAQRTGAPEQPALPAWLETLRSGERQNTASDNTEGTAFSSADLVDEGMLPNWMRPERSDDNNPSGAFPARRPASAPAPNTDNAVLPPRNMSASSLIDEQFLPSWMQESSANAQQPAQENISAASLIQPGVLPEWMRSMEPAPPAPAPAPMNAQPGQPISGNDLIDQQSLPPWMTGQNNQGATPGQPNMSASSLLDMNALPSWMRENEQRQNNPNNAFPTNQPWQTPAVQNPPVYNQPQAPVQQAQPFNYQQPAPPAQPYNYQPPVAQQPPTQPYNYQPPVVQQQPNPNQNSNLVASSLIDMDALPNWLRTADGQRQGMASPQQQPSADNLRQSSFGVPPRPESVRVPSRPRGEVEYHEDSEVAANAFASMLGVASATPNFPGQQPKDAYYSAQPTIQTQQASGSLQNPGMGARPSGPIQGPGNAPNQGGMQGNQQGYTQVPPGYPQGGYPMGSMPGLQSQPLQPPMPQGAPSQSTQQKQPAKPAKRGFLSTILDWFPFSR